MSEKDKYLSKTLSWLLRHSAKEEGLDVSPEGYVRVSEILKHKNIRHQFTVEDIKRVVENNEKKRFILKEVSFNSNKKELAIKACQGHSFAVNLELKPITKPIYNKVVHGTYLSAWNAIQRHGLSRRKRLHIHFAKGTLEDKNIISGLRRDVEIYIFIDLKKALDDGIKFFESENGVILTEGDEEGYLKPKYFLKVIKVATVMEVGRAAHAAAHSAPRARAAPRAHTAPAPAPNAPPAGPANTNSPRRRQKPPPPDNGNGNGADNGFKLKVYVSGFPPYTQAVDLTRTFTKFGTVRVDKLNQHMRTAVLAFATEAEAKAAIQASKKVNIYGEFLFCRQFNARDAKQQGPKREFIRTKQKGVIVEPTEMDLSGDFPSQVEAVLAGVRLTLEEALAVHALYADLQQVMQALWPGCVAMPFGSITTGLGIKTSDADCYVHVPAAYRSGQHTFVNKAKRALQAYPQTFTEILAIPRANTPIVKFFHVPTETSCDLSFKTPLGTRNSELIAFLLQARPELLPAAVTLKYWAKLHGLTGTGRLTNYALTMMIIFYLQQPPHCILPSVESLQRDPARDVIVDQWNTGFDNDRTHLPPYSDTPSISELLGGFFQYYTKFNFEELVVCPYLGRPVEKAAFVDMSRLPAEFSRYKTNFLTHRTPAMRAMTSICVQDPFEQCHNVASAVSGRLAAEIRAFFKFAANAYEREMLNECRDFLKTILLQKPKVVREKAHPEVRINLYPRVIGNILQADWKSVVRDATLTIFETMLKINLGKVEEKVNPDAKKEKERFMGTVTKAIWKRKQFTRLYLMMNLDFIQKQARITEEILAVEQETFNIEFQLTLTYSHSPKNTVVSMKLSNGDIDGFKEFGKFFQAVMHNWFTTLIKPHKKPSPPDTPDKIKEVIKSIDSNNDLDSDDDDEKAEENANCVNNGNDTEGNDTSEGIENDVSESTDEDLGVGKVSNHREENKGALATTLDKPPPKDKAPDKPGTKLAADDVPDTTATPNTEPTNTKTTSNTNNDPPTETQTKS